MKRLSGFDEFMSKIESQPGTYVVDFWGPSCSPCVALSQLLKELEPVYPEVQFYSVNADEEIELAAMLGVRGLPTLLLFQNGKEQARIMGNISRSKLASKIEGLSRDGACS